MNIGYEMLATGQMLFYSSPQGIEFVGVEWTVNRSPVDRVRGTWLIHDKNDPLGNDLYAYRF